MRLASRSIVCSFPSPWFKRKVNSPTQQCKNVANAESFLDLHPLVGPYHKHYLEQSKNIVEMLELFGKVDAALDATEADQFHLEFAEVDGPAEARRLNPSKKPLSYTPAHVIVASSGGSTPVRSALSHR